MFPAFMRVVVNHPYLHQIYLFTYQTTRFYVAPTTYVTEYTKYSIIHPVVVWQLVEYWFYCPLACWLTCRLDFRLPMHSSRAPILLGPFATTCAMCAVASVGGLSGAILIARSQQPASQPESFGPEVRHRRRRHPHRMRNTRFIIVIMWFVIKTRRACDVSACIGNIHVEHTGKPHKHNKASAAEQWVVSISFTTICYSSVEKASDYKRDNCCACIMLENTNIHIRM